MGYITGPSDFRAERPEFSRWTETPKAICEPGDVLVTVKGAGVGKVNLAPDVKAAIGRQVMAIRADKQRLDPRYLASFLRTQLSYFQERAVGATIPGLSRGDLEDIRLPLPTLYEQRHIAARLKAQLAEVETARQAALLQRRETDALLASLYREAFAQVVPVAVPPSFDDAPAGWQWHKLGDLARLESGHTPSRSRPDWWGGDVSWVSLTEIRALDGRWVDGTELRTNAAGIANSAARILPRGTVCFSRTASVGFVTIMATPMATSQDFANWVCGDDLDPEFLMYALIRSRRELREIATGATHKTIYMPQLESFHLCAPGIDTQRRIVAQLKARLAETSALRDAMVHQHRELEALPQRILTQAFDC
jgi:type I restriction enzyme S subunit